MFQGTGSDVGKSLIVAGLARALANRGLRVRPFKPQNMSNNAAVTADGGEIGRAQALQARAARTPTSVHMNPVLLKPQSEVGAQIVVQGRVHATAKAAAYQHMKPDLARFVLDSYARLKGEADIVLVEGAGGIAVPILADYDFRDLAKEIGLHVIVVAANCLGVLNHTRLTVEAIRSAGLKCSLIALNSVQCEPDISQATNMSFLKSLVDVPITAVEHNQREFGDLIALLW